MTPQKFLRIFALLTALFVIVRLIFFRQIAHTPLFDIPILDSEFYHTWARSLAIGQGHPPGPFWLSPLYPVFLAAVFAVTGSASIGLAVVVQMMLSVVTLVMLTLFARRLFGDPAALATAALAALCAPWLYYDGVLLSASLIIFLNSVILYLLVTRTGAAGIPAGSAQPLTPDWTWAVIGALTGISALARPSILIFALLLILWQRRTAGVPFYKFRFLKQPAIFAGAILLALSPALIRNAVVTGEPVLSTSSGGVNFFIGNRVGASGMYDEFDFIKSFDPWREAEGFRAEAAARTGREMSLTQASRFWMGQALRDITVYPLDWLVLTFKKIWLTVQREEIPNNISFRGVAGFAPILGSLPVRWALLFPLGMAGLYLIIRRRHPARTLILLYGLAYLLTNVVFFSSSEYRFPLVLVLLPLAGFFLASVWTLLEAKNVRELLIVSGIYLLALFLVNVPSREVKQAVTPRADYFNMATVAVDRNRIPESIPLYARSLAADPSYRDARLGLATSLWRLGNFDDARREFLMAGVTPPDTLSGQPLDTFLEQLWHIHEEGGVQDVLDYLDRTFPLDGTAPVEVWRARAQYQVEAGLYSQAVESLVRGAEQEPDNPEWYYRAGLIAAQGGDSTRSEELQRRAVEIYAAYAPSRIELGFRAVHERDIGAATAQLYELRRILIPDDSIRVKVERLALAIDSLASELSKGKNY